MQHVLVTGGAGFIGSHVVNDFMERGARVTVLDDLSSGTRANLREECTFFPYDVRSTAAAAVVRDGRFDVICHLAAQIDVRQSVRDPAHDAAINVVGTINLLEAVRTSERPTTRFILSSTGGALYGDGVSQPTGEGEHKAPQSPYGNAKLSAEYYLAYYARVHGLETVSLRYGNVYGPRQDPHGEAGVVAIFCERLLAGESLTIFGDGGQTRDYVYVGDVAAANGIAATVPLAAADSVDARAFNIGTGEETDVRTLARMLQSIAGTAPSVTYAEARPGEVRRSCLDIGKAARELHWTPTTSLSRGLRETFHWFSARHQLAAD